MERATQLRMIAWVMGVSAITTAATCILQFQDGDLLLALLTGVSSLINASAVVMCCKGLRKLKKEQDTEE